MRARPPRCAARDGALCPRSEYVRSLAARLPADLRRENPRKLWAIGALVSAYGAVLLHAAETPSGLLVVPSALALSPLGFLAHDLSHGTIVGKARWRYTLEVFLWAFAFIPATLWRRHHNQTHHFQYRRVPSSLEPGFRTREAPCSRRERFQLAGEGIGIVLLQAGVFLAAGGDLWAYVLCSPAAVLLSLLLMAVYLGTNHATGVDPAVDPVLGTTSVIVPRVLDRMHSNYSYHVEHHLFPGVDSSRYPEIGAALQELFPDRYRRRPLLTVWRERLVEKWARRSSIGATDAT